MSKGKVTRIGDKADLILTKLKHEALIKHKKILFKNQILDWIVENSLSSTDLKAKFSKWVKSL